MSVTGPINSLYSALHGRLRALGCRLLSIRMDVYCHGGWVSVNFEWPEDRRLGALEVAVKGFDRELRRRTGRGVYAHKLDANARRGMVLFRTPRQPPSPAKEITG